ncbi:MAG: TetR/AcrR family transcriptional regulator [Proteobacteria bacterium]|nr:TetR/AcrR family transcriptional regulator [Pseudomonadota bacterium]
MPAVSGSLKTKTTTPRRGRSSALRQGVRPQQARSRARVDRILRATRALIRDEGVAALKMSALARRASVPIGSVYQYFPTKSVLVARLYEDTLAGHKSVFRRALSGIRTREQFLRVFPVAVLELYEASRAKPHLREIWGGVQSDRALRHIHTRDDDGYVKLIYDLLRQCDTRLAPARLLRRLRVVSQMWDGTIRVASTLDERVGRALVKESISIGLRELGILAKA